jgi:hypothetical protein
MDVTFDRLVEISVILGIAFVYPDVQWALLLLKCFHYLFDYYFSYSWSCLRKTRNEKLLLSSRISRKNGRIYFFNTYDDLAKIFTSNHLNLFCSRGFYRVSTIFRSKKNFKVRELSYNEKI